jgi:uncharacterized protein YjbI with pentapeptide repeats
MSEYDHGSSEGETPVNPYSLLEAVNRSSDTAHTAWIIFLGIMAYILIAVAGVTHKDLLLERAVELPVLQVEIQLAQFFQFAPLILVLMHLGLISQLVLLARETIELDRAIRLLETTERRTHPLRLELNNYFFVQAIAGPQRSSIMSAFLHGMSWLTLVIIPVVLLLYIQVVFLPYHDVGITWTQRLLLLFDIAILATIGVFLARTETSFLQAFLRTSAAHPFGFMVTAALMIGVAFFSLFVATVPGEALDRMIARKPLTAKAGVLGAMKDRQAETAGFKLPFIGASVDGSLFGIFLRNLVVTDTDLVADKEQTPGEPSLSLRGRDLRYARLDRSDLHQADLTGADLQGASLVGTDLRGALLQCADINELLLSQDHEGARCTSARAANFSRAKLSQAILTGLDARGSSFDEASLDSVQLSYARLTGASFASANMEKAEVTGGVDAQGANFLIAALQGADFNGAQLQFADFSSASMQGVQMSHAQLQGAVLRDVDLEGASLVNTRLEGADLTGAKISAADFRGAKIWLTQPPEADATGLADFSEIAMAPLTETDAERLNAMLGRIESKRVRGEVQEALAPILDLAESPKWADSPQQSRWQAHISAATAASAPEYRARLTDYLNAFMCKARWSNGAVATGVARRAQAPQFRGDLVAIYDRTKADNCPGGQQLLPKVQKQLSTAADIARSN